MSDTKSRTSPEVCIVTNQQQWNIFLEQHPQGHLLQTYEWGELHEYLGSRVYRLGAFEEDQLVGIMMLSVAPLPLPIPWIKKSLSWLYCSRGPLVTESHLSALLSLINYAHSIAEKERAVVLRLEPNIADDTPTQDAWRHTYQLLGFQTSPFSTHGRRSWVLDIQPGVEQLTAQFRKSWRQNIRLAEREGVTVREAITSSDFEDYYQLLQCSSIRDGFFIHEKEYHHQILKQFSKQGNAVLLIAEYQEQPVAAKMLLRFGDWCWDMFAGMTDKYPSLPKNHILQYHSILWAKSQGCKFFDFRTIPENLQPGEDMWGVYHFKKGFGGFSRLHMPTQDYVYRPLLYQAWRSGVRIRRLLRSIRHKGVRDRY